MRHRLLNWLYNLVPQWEQYQQAYRHEKALGVQPLDWFCRLYVPLYRMLALPLIRRHELESDRYPLEIMNDDDVLEMIEFCLVIEKFLDSHYWPKFQHLVQQKTAPSHFPHASMQQAVGQNMAKLDTQAWLQELFTAGHDHPRPTPSLADRMENIGHSRIRTLNPVIEFAAPRYLGKTLARITQAMDKRWLKQVRPTEKRQTHKEQRQKQWLQTLAKKADQIRLSERESWEYAKLLEKFQGKQAALPVYKNIIENNPTHTKALFAIGRILLHFDKPQAGIKAVEKAVALDNSLANNGYKMIENYFAKRGKTENANVYRQKAISMGA